MISPQTIAHYLVRRKLLRSNEVLAPGLTISNVSRRNCAISVIRDGNPSYLVKQGVGVERITTMRHEALVYQFLGEHNGLSSHLPRNFGFDAGRHLLILEFFKGSQNLSKYFGSAKRPPASIGAMLGRALAEIHSYRPKDRRARNVLVRSGRGVPLILGLHKPSIRSLRNLSEGQIELIKIVQRFGFGKHLDRLKRGWRSTSLTHGDLRFDNCLVPDPFSGDEKTCLRIVDWEFSGFGDPAWDVGFIFAEHLIFWVSSVPITGDSPPDRCLNIAEMPLERMQPLLRSFWSSYHSRMRERVNVDHTEAQQLLLRALGYAPVRLLQSAFEEMRSSSQLTGRAICLAQLSLNMFQRSQRAFAELLGLRI